MMYGPTDLKKGRVIVVDGKPYQVIDYAQKVMGRGGSIVNVRIKNLIDGSVLAKTYKGQDKIEAAEVSHQVAQYLYSDAEKVYFMNPDTFEQFELPLDEASDVPSYLREGAEVQLQFFDGRVIAVALPTSTSFGPMPMRKQVITRSKPIADCCPNAVPSACKFTK